MRTLVCGAVVGGALLAGGAASGQSEGATRAEARTIRDERRAGEPTSLPVVAGVLRLIREKYVQPSHVPPRALLLAALRQIEKELGPVLVSQGKANASLDVHVGASHQRLRIDTVYGLWDVAARLAEVFSFLHAELQKHGPVDRRTLEYAASVGLLGRLDAQNELLRSEAFSDLLRNTAGGAGIAVSVRHRMLAVTRVLPGSPALRAGLRAGDGITRIDGSRIVEMTPGDALQRLRGPVGAPLKLSVLRSGPDGWNGEKSFVVLRELIASSPIDARMLAPGIGYILVKRFESTTADQLKRALVRLAEQRPLTGLVLDLRNNAGGLLAEAAKVADAFLEKGSLVAVRHARENEDTTAKNDGTEPQCPLVILNNAVTASGSEIVASALQNNGRALVLGQTSFGMGKIQLILPIATEQASVRLTIAQFQAPAGTGIQGVGVVPDVALQGVMISASELRFFAAPVRHRDRDPLLLFPHAAPPHQPVATVWYQDSLPELELMDPGDWAVPEPHSDFTAQFAGELVAQLPQGTRAQQLESARVFSEKVRAREMSSITARLKALGIDWGAPPPIADDAPQSSDFLVRVTTDRARDTAPAGEAMTLVVAVTNRSRAPAYRVRAVTHSDNDDYRKELLFGQIAPGKTVTRRVPFGRCEAKLLQTPASARSAATSPRTCYLSASAASREDIVKIVFSAEGGAAPASAELRPTVTSRPQVVAVPAVSSAPSIDIAPLALVHRQERVRIQGVARSPHPLEEVYVFADERKVFHAFAPASSPVLPFSFDLLLEPGINVLRVLARDSNDVTSSLTFIARRDGMGGEPLARSRHPSSD